MKNKTLYIIRSLHNIPIKGRDNRIPPLLQKEQQQKVSSERFSSFSRPPEREMENFVWNMKAFMKYVLRAPIHHERKVSVSYVYISWFPRWVSNLGNAKDPLSGKEQCCWNTKQEPGAWFSDWGMVVPLGEVVNVRKKTPWDFVTEMWGYYWLRVEASLVFFN